MAQSLEWNYDITLSVEPKVDVTLEEEEDVTLGVKLEGNITLELLEFWDGIVNPFSSTGTVLIFFIINVRIF